MGLLISFAGLHAQEYIGRRMLIAKEKRQAKRMRKMNSSSSLITNNNLAGANSHNGVRGRDYFESPEFHDGNSPATLNYGGREVRDTKRRRAPAMSGSLDDYEDENLIA
ncbi:uncharacterized protein LOC135829012 [Sycon ciliatum]|uniref:uncharacterized protein LOC135829012 n=1 Tax=Sycon ciliatum TaxID=27933 RepID=UPI0031F6A817